jgi:hypothetical protein
MDGVRIGGRYTRPRITGSVTVNRGDLYLDELYRQYLIVSLEDPLLNLVVDTSLIAVKRVLPPSENPFIRNMRIENASIRVDRAMLRSREMDVEITSDPGELTVTFDRCPGLPTETAQCPEQQQTPDIRVAGTLHVVRGVYRMEALPIVRVFQVDSGSVSFAGTPGVNPNLSIVATHRARTGTGPLDIHANVYGTLQAPRVRLFSDASPPISESDLASYLFFGAPTYAFNLGATALGGGGGEGALIGSLGIQSFTASSLGYLSSAFQTIGQNLGLLDYIGFSATEASPGQVPSGFGGIFANTQLELGRYLGRDVFVAASQRIGTPGATPGIRVEWEFHPTFSLEAFVQDRFARTPSFGLSQAIAQRREYGFFLFRQWGY